MPLFDLATIASPDAFLDQLVTGAVTCFEELDRRISQHVEHWRIERMPTVDATSCA